MNNDLAYPSRGAPLDFASVKQRAHSSLEGALQLYVELLEKAPWPDELLELKRSVGVWQIPFIEGSIEELKQCSTDRRLDIISNNMFQYQQNLQGLQEKLSLFFEYSEEAGTDILKPEFYWASALMICEVRAYELMSASAVITERIRSITDSSAQLIEEVTSLETKLSKIARYREGKELPIQDEYIPLDFAVYFEVTPQLITRRMKQWATQKRYLEAVYSNKRWRIGGKYLALDFVSYFLKDAQPTRRSKKRRQKNEVSM